MIQFGDAIDPNTIPYDYAALYSADCDHPAQDAPPPGQNRWPASRRRWYTFAGNPACSMIDYEKFTRDYNDPSLLFGWLKMRAGRRPVGSHTSIVYCSRSLVASVVEIAKGQPHLWNIATLDGHQWSQDELAADIAAHWGAVIAPESIWANQWLDNGEYDTNNLFGDWWL